MRKRSSFLAAESFEIGVSYTRWFCFVLHEGLLAASLALVQRRHTPFIVLLNYLWPTTVILCSVSVGAARVARWWSVILGSFLVLGSIGFEVLGPHPATAGLFAAREVLFSSCSRVGATRTS